MFGVFIAKPNKHFVTFENNGKNRIPRVRGWGVCLNKRENKNAREN
jgi:hypothetical protein